MEARYKKNFHSAASSGPWINHGCSIFVHGLSASRAEVPTGAIPGRDCQEA